MASILSISNWGNSSNDSRCSVESMAPKSSRGVAMALICSMPSTFAPCSAAEMTAGKPPVRHPTTTTSTSTVSVMSVSATSGAAPNQLGVPGICVATFFASAAFT